VIIGIGIDVAEVSRYAFDDTKLARFAKKVFTEAEIAHALKHRHFAERLAGAFAAKEATRKAFGHAIPWRSMGVRHERSGKPYMELTGRAATLPALRGVREMHLSITHSKTTAVAVLILEGDEVRAAASSEVASR
jgi:holo-[acyl-carrier protein] synthase